MNSNVVNSPTDIKQKERDINTKLQLYGIYKAFANGKVPSNKQIDVALNSALESSALKSPSSKLSPEGQELVGELRNVIEQAKELLLVKNDGNVLQDFIWHTEQLGTGSATAPDVPIDKQTAQQHGTDALDGLRTLGALLISNGQFRKLLSDATVLLRDVAGDAAANAATRVKPSESELSQIDHPADDNTWHDAPVLSKESIRNQLKNQYSRQKPPPGQDVQETAADTTRATHPIASHDPESTASNSARNQREGTTSSVDALAGAQAGVQGVRQRAGENIPDEAKDRAKNYHGRAMDYLGSKIPQERRDRTIWRLKKMVVEVQGHKDYQQAIETLLRLAEIYAGHGKNLHQQGQSNIKGAHENDHLKAAEADLKLLVQRLANNTSIDDLFDAINNIYRDADRDPELKDWFRKLNAYIHRCLQEQGFILQDTSNDEWNDIYDRGQFLLRNRYRNHTNRIIDESKFLMDEFAEDPQSKKFKDATQKLFTHLGNDENGKPVFKKHLVKDLTSVIIPAIFENVRYVPVPRTEFSDHTVDAIVENLVIESDNLMPNVLEVENDNHFRWGRKQIGSKRAHSVTVSASGIQCDLRDVSYYIKKKGFPSITDQGVVDILLGGRGLSFKMKLSTVEKKGRQCFFKVDKVDVDVKHFNVKLKRSNHKMLFSLFKPLLLRVLRPVVEKALEKQIKDSVRRFDSLVYQIHQDAEAAAKQVRDDPSNAPNVYSRHYSAAQKRLLHGEKKRRVTADRRVKIAVTQQDSMFKSISLPGGISSKATEYKELAAKDDKWESPVFSIGSAQESSGLPKGSPITRKHHSVRQGELGGSNGSTSVGTGDFSDQVNQAFDSNAQQGYVGNSNNNITRANGSTSNGNQYAGVEKRDLNRGYHGALSRVTG
ncbi:MAG: hypothetical protein M1840_005058 [Geoglossum simile]|nr:MAG: hypothetical protein M1840_005058 [Geoglossum simile]